MAKKDNQLVSKKLSSKKKKDFLVQSKIEDYFEENNNNNIDGLDKEKMDINENLEKDDIKKSSQINENNEENLSSQKCDKNTNDEKLIEVKIENEEIKNEEEKLLENVLEIEKKETKENGSAETDEKDEVALQKKKLDEIEQSVSKQSSKKSKITNLIFFIVNILIVGGLMAYQILQEEFVPLSGLRLDVLALFICVVLFAGTILTDTIGFGYLLKQSTGKWRLGLAFKLNELGRYYDAITPMAAGGQPFEITYLKSRGVPIHSSLSIPLTKYLFSQIAWVIVCLACLIVSFLDNSYGTFVSVMSIIGFVFSFFMLAITVFLSVCKTVGKKLVVKSLKLLQKMKIVKNYDKQYEKITKYISDFQDVMKQYAKSPKDFIIMMFLSLAKLLINYSIPFFVVMVFMPGVESSLYIRLLVLSVLVDLSASFFPTPGGAGISEISFASAFGSIVGENNILVWVILLWRFFSYYIYLIQGVFVLSYDIAIGNRKYKWQVRKEKLVEESAVFKQNQIDKFRNDRAKRRKSKQKNIGIKEYL